MSATKPLLEARGLTVQLGGTVVLAGVDLAFAPGELVALVGPNGAGKSTLLAALAGDLLPSLGTVLLCGEELARTSLGTRAQRRAVLQQRTEVALPFTVEQVVRMGRSPWLAVAEEVARDDEVVATAIERTDLLALSGRRVTELSGGELARVGLARVLAQGCDVLLLDEPTAALDLRHQETTMLALRAEADADRAVVVAIHDLDLAAAHADRLVVVDDGRVVADGPTGDVLDGVDLGAVYGIDLEVVADGRGGRIVRPRRER
jgi:iron complex transport system ATP-binding protein